MVSTKRVEQAHLATMLANVRRELAVLGNRGVTMSLVDSVDAPLSQIWTSEMQQCAAELVNTLDRIGDATIGSVALQLSMLLACAFATVAKAHESRQLELLRSPPTYMEVRNKLRTSPFDAQSLYHRRIEYKFMYLTKAIERAFDLKTVQLDLLMKASLERERCRLVPLDVAPVRTKPRVVSTAVV